MSKKLPADLIFNQFIYHGDAIPRHISHLVLANNIYQRPVYYLTHGFTIQFVLLWCSVPGYISSLVHVLCHLRSERGDKRFKRITQNMQLIYCHMRTECDNTWSLAHLYLRFVNKKYKYIHNMIMAFLNRILLKLVYQDNFDEYNHDCVNTIGFKA